MEERAIEINEKDGRVKRVERYRWVVWIVLAAVYIFVTFHRMAAGVVKTDLEGAFNIGCSSVCNPWIHVFLCLFYYADSFRNTGR